MSEDDYELDSRFEALVFDIKEAQSLKAEAKHQNDHLSKDQDRPQDYDKKDFRIDPHKVSDTDDTNDSNEPRKEKQEQQTENQNQIKRNQNSNDTIMSEYQERISHQDSQGYHEISLHNDDNDEHAVNDEDAFEISATDYPFGEVIT